MLVRICGQICFWKMSERKKKNQSDFNLRTEIIIGFPTAPEGPPHSHSPSPTEGVAGVQKPELSVAVELTGAETQLLREF